eukprot:11120320-Alexandrium_andersonii.AAC.1
MRGALGPKPGLTLLRASMQEAPPRTADATPPQTVGCARNGQRRQPQSQRSAPAQRARRLGDPTPRRRRATTARLDRSHDARAKYPHLQELAAAGQGRPQVATGAANASGSRRPRAHDGSEPLPRVCSRTAT